MRVAFRQCYIEVGIVYPLSTVFQKRLSRSVSSRVQTSKSFAAKYGGERNLTINISAKENLKEYEAIGPILYKQDEPIEFNVFLPFYPWDAEGIVPSVFADVFRLVLNATAEVLSQLEIDTTKLMGASEGIVQSLCSDPKIIRLWS